MEGVKPCPAAASVVIVGIDPLKSLQIDFLDDSSKTSIRFKKWLTGIQANLLARCGTC